MFNFILQAFTAFLILTSASSAFSAVQRSCQYTIRSSITTIGGVTRVWNVNSDVTVSAIGPEVARKRARDLIITDVKREWDKITNNTTTASAHLILRISGETTSCNQNIEGIYKKSFMPVWRMTI